MTIFTIVTVGISLNASAKSLGGSESENTAETKETSASSGKALSKNPFDLDGDKRLQSGEVFKLMKQNKIPGIDLTDKKYAGIDGWQKFQQDLKANPEFKELYKKLPDQLKKSFNRKLSLLINADAVGGDGTVYGGVQASFQRLVGNDDVANKIATSAYEYSKQANSAAELRNSFDNLHKKAHTDF